MFKQGGINKKATGKDNKYLKKEKVFNSNNFTWAILLQWKIDNSGIERRLLDSRYDLI